MNRTRKGCEIKPGSEIITMFFGEASVNEILILIQNMDSCIYNLFEDNRPELQAWTVGHDYNIHSLREGQERRAEERFREE